MRITEVQTDGESLWILAQFGFGGGYAQASRYWKCNSVADAMGADISEVHENTVSLPSIAKDLLSRGDLRSNRGHADFGCAQDAFRAICESLGMTDAIAPKAWNRQDRVSAKEVLDAATAAVKAQLAAAQHA